MSHALMRKGLDKDVYEGVYSVCMDVTNKEITAEQVMNSFGHIMAQLDKVGLTKLDTKPVYNRNSIESSNKAQGYG